jgi:hypothetical protein
LKEICGHNFKMKIFEMERRSDIRKKRRGGVKERALALALTLLTLYSSKTAPRFPLLRSLHPSHGTTHFHTGH